jgi:hypothetical protein
MPFAEVGKLTDADLKALWAYLKSVPPVAHDVERASVDVKDNPAINEHPEVAAAALPPPGGTKPGAP